MGIRFASVITVYMSLLCMNMAIAQTTSGNCSPNGQILINNVFICAQELSENDKRELKEIKHSLEVLASQGPEASKQIRERLLQISDMASGHLEALRAYNTRFMSEIKGISATTDALLSRVESLTRLQYDYVVDVNAIQNPELEGKPKLLYIPRSNSVKTFGELVAETNCKSITASNEIFESNKELSRLILVTESMDCDERQYWFDILPSMNKSQINRLFDILETERTKLEALEIKYQKEIRCLNNKHLYEWNLFEGKDKNKRKDVGEALKAAVEYYYSGCASVETPKTTEINNAILAAIETPERYGDTYSGATALSKLFNSDEYHDFEKAKFWAKLAAQQSNSDWDSVDNYLRILTNNKDYEEAYRFVSSVIKTGHLDELKGDSETAIKRKISLYWRHLWLARETKHTGEIDTIAVAGYNLSKMLLEKYPNNKYLGDTIFFVGYLAQNHKKYRKTISDYMDAIGDIAISLYDSEVITSKQFASNALSLSWYCLYAENHDCSVKMAEKGLAADKEHIALYTNMAHGLALSDRIDEARIIYYRYRGEDLGENGSWETVILDDIGKLELAGYSSAIFNEVKSTFNQTKES